MTAPANGQNADNRRRAIMLNAFLPGVGQLYLGQKMLGILLCAAFLACLFLILWILVQGFKTYAYEVVTGMISDENWFEHVATMFHLYWLLGLFIAGKLIYLAALFAVTRTRKA